MPTTAIPGTVRRVRRRVRATRRRGDRRGSALILTLVLTVAMAALATSAIYLAGNAQLLSGAYDRERDLRYAAEAALAMGKSKLNYDPYAAPDTGFVQVWAAQPVLAADGTPVPGVTTDLYLGPTSSHTGQFGRFVSAVAVAHGATGATVVRRLELAQESFAKFAYWSNSESNNGSPIYFGGNDQLWGPVWSNDIIHLYTTGARFHSDVGTAQSIEGKRYGRFDKGYAEHQRPITLPNNTTLANLPGYAASGHFAFTSPNGAATPSQVQMRIEFLPVNLNPATDTTVTDADEGFFRVYVSRAGPAWLRADWSSRNDNCGAFYVLDPAGRHPWFVPLSEHTKGWFWKALAAAGWSASAIDAVTDNRRTSVTSTMTREVLSQPSARCFPGGDPRLRAVDLRSTSGSGYAADTTAVVTAASPADVIAAAERIAGWDTTFTASSRQGYWMSYPGPVDARVTAARAARGADAGYLYPIYRGLNPGTKGVIYVNGSTALSGTLRGRVTLYATGNVTLIDDVQYTTDPSLGRCADILGVIAGANIMVADNAVQGPENPGGGFRSFDDTKDVFLNGVLMALNTSFGAEHYAAGPLNALGCEGQPNGRGCLYLTGGLIQEARGPVGTFQYGGATGYAKRYSYDRCALYNPPPYFPTTGRYTENRYYEIDPVHFDVAALYRSLTPTP